MPGDDEMNVYNQSNWADPCFCGNDCSRCVTYLATAHDDDTLRRQAQEFYRNFIKREIPLCKIQCRGGRSDDVFCLCQDCPFAKCCKNRGISSCGECKAQCRTYLDYKEKYVNQYNQI
jgi:hypothetical protein